MKASALIVGYYGYNNAGDERLLMQTKRLLKEFQPNIPIKVLSKVTNKQLNTINRFSIIGVTKAIFSSKWVVFGGGGLLQDVTSARSLIYYLSLIVCAKVMFKKVILLGQGIGPIKRPYLHFLTRIVLPWVSIVSVRDTVSFQNLKALSVPDSKAYLTADLAYFLPPVCPPRMPESHLIGLSLRRVSYDLPGLDAVIKWINVLQHSPQFMEFCAEDDREYFRSVFPEPVRAKWPEPIKIDGNFESNIEQILPFSLVIAMRYHALVCASLLSIPFLALAYDDKVVQLAEELGQTYLDLRKPLTEKEVEAAYQEILSKWPRQRNTLQKKVPELVKRAHLNQKILNENIYLI